MELVLCFLGATTAGVLFTVPRPGLLPCGLLGCVGWFTAEGFDKLGWAPAAGDFMAALVVSLGAEVCARRLKMPVLCFGAPGLIPLVPGMSAYGAMYALVNGHYEKGQQMALDTLLAAAAISAGLVLAGAMYPRRKPVVMTALLL
ncbi:MAG TPA: threonine/serine exporter family protein, partial [Candidatus Xenobia bacterium]